MEILVLSFDNIFSQKETFWTIKMSVYYNQNIWLNHDSGQTFQISLEPSFL